MYREKTPELPRSGTIPVEQIVSSHPWVIGAGELPFWRQQAIAVDEADHPGTIDEAAARRLAGEYLAVLRRSSATAARVIDKMPFNFLWIGLARLALPHARFIHCRRHPVDTCLSIYCTSLELLRGFVGDRDDLVFFYREYIRLMEHWRAVLPADRFIDVDYELLTADLETQARRLIAFCGLEWDAACLHLEGDRRAVQPPANGKRANRSIAARWSVGGVMNPGSTPFGTLCRRSLERLRATHDLSPVGPIAAWRSNADGPACRHYNCLKFAAIMEEHTGNGGRRGSLS